MGFRKICDLIIEYSFYLLFFLVPLVMTLWNFELFEYNKMMTVYAFTVIITGTWFSKMILARQIIFRRTPFDIPLLCFFVFQFFSFLFSIDRYTSLWGYYSRFHGGLLSTLSYLLLYWAFVSNFDRNKTLSAIRYMLYAAALVAFYGILEHFGIDAKYWVQDVKSRVFSTLGQPNWLAAYLLALIPLPLAFALNFKFRILNFKFQMYFYYLLFAIYLICLLFTNSRSGHIAAYPTFGFFVFLLLLNRISVWQKKWRLAYWILCGLLVGSLLIWGTRFVLQNQNDIAYIFGFQNQANITPQKPFGVGSSSADIRKIVWRGAVNIARHYPLFGSGVETFAYSYYQFRPVQHNLLSEWDFLYNKAHNEYFNFLATTGLVGLGSYLLLIFWIIFWFFQKIKLLITNYPALPAGRQLLISALFAGWSSILITNFFGFSVVPVALSFFLFPAFAVILASDDSPLPTPPKQTSITNYQLLIIIFIFFTICYLLINIVKHWQADTDYAMGSRLGRQGEYPLAYSRLQDALRRNPQPPVYHDELAWINANLAFFFSLQKDEENAKKFTEEALVSSDRALAASPYNLNFFKTRAKIYFRLAQVDIIYLEEAKKVLLRARQVAPTDAKIVYNLALIHQTVGQKEEAIKTFEEAVRLKPNYFETRIALIGLYKQSGQIEKALGHYKVLYPDEPDPLGKVKDWKN